MGFLCKRAKRRLSEAVLTTLLVVGFIQPSLGQSTAQEALGFLQAQVGFFGLLDSFVEDQADFAYTYDNALAALAFISTGNLALAGSILDAYATIGPEPDGGFLHRYRASDGGPANGLEVVGHNAYLLQAMALYSLERGDSTYEGLATNLADYLLAHQDVDGGLFGRFSVTWKSTEHNLAAYSAIHNMAVVFGLPRYEDFAQAVRAFIEAECWDEVRFFTGENDPMIVTDVQALGTMILGPGFASGSYWVEDWTLTTRRYHGQQVTGFDLNIDRDTVWTEGTLQQAMAFLLAGDLARADGYMTEAEKLFRPSGAFLEASNVGTTGFGENFRRWQAVAPTAWYVLLANQDNVLTPLSSGNDIPGITVTPTTGLVTTEAGGTDTFTVVLDTSPIASVTIALSSSNLAEGTVSPTSLTFTFGNGTTPQTATVTGVNDAVVDGDIAYTIVTDPATSSDPNYNGINPADVSVTNTDDDLPGGSVSYMYVQSVSITLTQKGRNWEGRATVIVVDETGTPVKEATVTGDWDLNGTKFDSGASGTTNGQGAARINSGKVTANSGGVFTLTVTDLSGAGFTWDDSVGAQSGTATVP